MRTSSDGPPVAMETLQNKHLGALLVHKERQNSSRFLVSAAQTLEKLPLLKGACNPSCLPVSRQPESLHACAVPCRAVPCLAVRSPVCRVRS